jgi:hypothetical protein
MSRLRLPLAICLCVGLLLGFAIGFVGRVAVDASSELRRCAERGGTWTLPGYCVRRGPAGD